MLWNSALSVVLKLQLKLGVDENFGHGTKCDALPYWCLVAVLRYEVQVPNIRIASAQVDNRSNNIGVENPQVGSLMMKTDQDKEK